jgi:hypothetical protein
MVSSGIEYRTILRYRGAIPRDRPRMNQAVGQFTFRAATAPITASKYPAKMFRHKTSPERDSDVLERSDDVLAFAGSFVESPRAVLPQRHLYSDGVCRFSRVVASVQLIEV